MSPTGGITIAYIVASALFILGLKMLGRAETARRGNLLSAIGMLLAVVATLLDRQIVDFRWIAIGVIAGGVIGVSAARLVRMTAMPEMVALFNGFGGLASLLVGWVEYEKILRAGWDGYSHGATVGWGVTATAVFFAVVVGGITFTGSIYAFLKLSGKVDSRARVFSGQHLLNAAILLVIVGAGFAYGWLGDAPRGETFFLLFLGLALLLGALAVMPIGGGDMPVVISSLNSLSGLAACSAGFVILNNVLIVAGCLVGASGLILTIIMCKAMNRTLANVFFSGFGATDTEAVGDTGGELKPISPDDAYFVLEAARQVAVIPGYGMAVAQAQHAVRELASLLENNGAEVHFAIHPVAGRMPGHMNVLLAEADVPYEQLVEMNTINPQMPTMDVALVIGANDVVNPAAIHDKSSPIHGMPIINAHEARTVIALKRGKGKGFSGIENQLFLLPNTRMLYGDAKTSIQNLVARFKNV